jgi:hypothetical protein
MIFEECAFRNSQFTIHNLKFEISTVPLLCMRKFYPFSAKNTTIKPNYSYKEANEKWGVSLPKSPSTEALEDRPPTEALEDKLPTTILEDKQPEF